MKKIISTLLIAVMAFVTLAQPMQARAEGVTHLTKDEVKDAIDKVTPGMGLSAFSEKEFAILAEKHSDYKPQNAKITLSSYGTDERSVQLVLLDGLGNPVYDVKWYAQFAYPADFLDASNQAFDNFPYASLSDTGLVTSLEEVTSTSDFYVWAEYDGAIFGFSISIRNGEASRNLMADKEVDKIIQEKGWNSLPTKAQKAEAVYKYLVDTVTYDNAYDNKFSEFLYSAVILKKAICRGYAEAFQTFMKKLDVQCAYKHGSMNSYLAHAWNIVELDDGAWYYVDATWGDGDNGLTYYYFLQSTTEFNSSHDSTVGTETTGTKYNIDYYKTNGLTASNATQLQSVIDKLLDNASGDAVTVCFAVTPGLATSVEASIRNKWTDITTLQAGSTNGVRIGGTRDDYFLQEYTICRNGASVPDPGQSSGGNTTDPDPGQGGSGNTQNPDPGQGGSGNTQNPDPGTQTPSQPVIPQQPVTPVAPTPTAPAITPAAPAAVTYTEPVIVYSPTADALKAIAAVKPGEIPNLRYCGGNKTVTKEVFQSIAGKESYFTFNMGNLWWLVDGRKIPKNAKLRDLNLKVELDKAGTSDLIPETLAAPVRPTASKVMKLRLQENGDFGYEMNLHIMIGAEYAFRNVKLLYHDPVTNTLIEVSNGIINHGGIVLLPMTWGRGSFLLVVE